MAQKLLSIYITNNIIKICEATKSGKNVKVKRVFQTKTPEGGMDDGMVVDAESVAAAIYGVLRENKIRKGKLVFTVASRKIANKEIMLPYMKNQKRIMEIIQANREDYFPMNNMEDYVCRYNILDTVEIEGNKQYNISVTAIQREIIASYFELGKILKMPVESIDYYGNSTYQLLRNQMDSDVVTLAIQVDSNMTYVNIMRGDAQLFRRSVPYGKEMLIENLMQLKGISQEEAEEAFTDVEKLDEYVSVEDYSEVVRDMVSAITRVVEFHTSRNPDTKVEYSSMYGEGNALIGLPEILSKELGVPITAQETLVGVHVKKNNKFGVTYGVLSNYLPNIGALIQPMDFTIDEDRAGSTAGEYTPFVVLIVLSAIVVIGVGGFTFYRIYQLNQEKWRLEDKVAQMALADDIYQDFLKQKGYMEIVNEYYATTRNGNEAMLDLFLYIEEIAPSGLGITALSSQDGGVTISGIASGKEGIALFISELKKADFITNVRIQNISETYDEFGSITATFNMTFNIYLTPERIANDLYGGGE